ncbi:MAG: Cleavage stimulation factor subunit 2, partial [Paramarteilia canceri]
GNIPYDAIEEKLKEIFGAAGRILSFRIVSERETGKPKGYGFCEYENADIAQSALRNLNNVSFNDRPLRIGPATAGEISARSQTSQNNSRQPNVVQNAHESFPQPSSNAINMVTQNNMTAQQPSNNMLTAPEQATQQETKIQSKDLPLEIAKKMTTLSPELLNQMVQQIKMISTKDPEQAKAILIHYPHLAYAILHALLLTKSVNSSEALVFYSNNL